MQLQLFSELLLHIAGFLDTSRDLLAMARLNTYSTSLFLPYLYNFNVRQQGSSDVLWATRNRKTNLANQLLRNHRANVNAADGKSRTPVFHAIRTKSERMVCALLETAADIDWQDENKQTPLLYALGRGFLSIASILLKYFNPSLHTKDRKDRNAIWYAVARRDENLVRLLLVKRSDICTMDYKRITPLKLAIMKQSVSMTKTLLEHSEDNPSQPRLLDINAIDHPLHLVAGAGLKEIIQLLLAYGADLNVRDRRGKSLLHRAAKKGMTTSSGRCSATKTSQSMRPTDKVAPHFMWQHFMDTSRQKKLILSSRGIDIDARDGDEATALVVAARENQQSVALQILAEERADINACCLAKHKTALHHSVQNGNVLLTCLLDLDRLNPNTCDELRWTPLSYATSKGDLRMVELLLTRTDLDVNVSNAPPLFLAAERGHLEFVRRLVHLEAVDINQVVWHKSPLFIAIEHGYLDVAKLLLEQGSRLDMNAKTLTRRHCTRLGCLPRVFGYHRSLAQGR